MPQDTHSYRVVTTWTGNRGTGTSDYGSYGREHEIAASGKSASIAGSSVPMFRGDAARYNPEELLVGALSACHMLWYLHLCANSGIRVTEYRDQAEGTIRLRADGTGEFSEVILHPDVRMADPARRKEAARLHAAAHEKCFIARSVNFPVLCTPVENG